MEKKALHIINGDSLNEQVCSLDISGKKIIWRGMLCEGPTLQQVDGEFFKTRRKFLRKAYGVSAKTYNDRFVSEIKELKKTTDFDHVILWFELDLFCHINMLAVINMLNEVSENVPFYLVCSKKLKGDDELKPLSHLSPKQLQKHFDKKIRLTTDDLEIAVLMWELYCSNNPIKLKPLIKVTSNFEYLSSCIRAHIERFPNSNTGINTLERNVLKLIEKQTITSENHLFGYALEYQGYYGYNDSQMQRLLVKLERFYNVKDKQVQLTNEGIEVLAGTKNFYQELKNDEYFGGAKMYDFLYDSENHQLLKL